MSSFHASISSVENLLNEPHAAQENLHDLLEEATLHINEILSSLRSRLSATKEYRSVIKKDLAKKFDEAYTGEQMIATDRDECEDLVKCIKAELHKWTRQVHLNTEALLMIEKEVSAEEQKSVQLENELNVRMKLLEGLSMK